MMERIKIELVPKMFSGRNFECDKKSYAAPKLAKTMAAVTPMNPKKDDVGSHCVPDAAMMLVRPLREKIILKSTS